MTLSRIEPATFRLVALCISQLSYRMPLHYKTGQNNKTRRHIPEGHDLHTQRCAELKSHIRKILHLWGEK